MKKSLKEIAWNVTEDIYRADPALSYSTIAKFEREGFNNLNHLFDKVESPSLLFGSCVDTLLTGSKEEFDSLYLVADYEEPSDKQKAIIKYIFNITEGNIPWENIDSDIFKRAVINLEYQQNWRIETRIKVIKESGKSYYDLLTLSNGKTVISQSLYNDVINCINALKTSDSTKWYFELDNPFNTDIERLYQLKFKGEYEGIPLRIMADEIIVNHKDKTIQPIDLKTSGKKEWEFPKSFIDWSYMIQAQLYVEIIRQNIIKDNYFKDFKILSYRFIVINRYSLTPLVWEFRNTFCVDGCTLGDNYYRGWREIVKELDYYLKKEPNIPIGISINKPNIIEEYFNDK